MNNLNQKELLNYYVLYFSVYDQIDEKLFFILSKYFGFEDLGEEIELLIEGLNEDAKSNTLNRV